MVYANGARYEGEWKGGNRHGQGKMTFTNNKNVFEGEWKNDKENGEGTCKWSTGASFTGEWQDGRMRNGKMVYSDGNEYVGELHDKQRSGRGSMHFTDKSLYTGAWVENKRHSSGRLSLPNGCITDLVYSHGKSFQWPISPTPLRFRPQFFPSTGIMRSSIRHCLYTGPLPLDDATCKAIADEIVRTKQCPGIATDVALNAVQQRHPGVLEDSERRKVCCWSCLSIHFCQSHSVLESYVVQARLVSRAVHYLDTKCESKAALEFAR